jgi:glucose-6-phosphate isomerase
MTDRELWERYKRYLCECEPAGLALDVSRVRFEEEYIERMAGPLGRAFDAMEALEKGAVANPDEKRMVGHYWLRAPELAPDPAIRSAIENALRDVKTFAARVHSGEIKPQREARFKNLVVVGIGGSALGPQFATDALGGPSDKMRILFVDNTDPDGIDRVFTQIGQGLGETLVVVISKSGGTKETRNGMLEAQAVYQAQRLDFALHAVAVTGAGSELDRHAILQRWVARFPMWDWVGGRTSELSPVGLLPAALQGLDIDGMLEGARQMDAATRSRDPHKNPAALMALMWFHATGGKGAKDMVVLPYKDRLLLLSRYLQQLVMESLGKEKDLDGRVVHQGIAVYGNKGSTDQHAYVQQLRDGVPNFFATFVTVDKDREGRSLAVETDVTSGDYLHGFWLGTRQALFENGRDSVTLRLPDVSGRSLGAVIALFERTVGLYASLVNINAYHQPGVEAGKIAAAAVIELQHRVLAALRAQPGTPMTVEQLAASLGAEGGTETLFHVLEHLASNVDAGVRRIAGKARFEAGYLIERGNS